MSGLGKTSVMEAVKHCRKDLPVLVASILMLWWTLLNAIYLSVQTTVALVSVPVGDGNVASSWNFRTRKKSVD